MPRPCPDGTGDDHSTGGVTDARSRNKVLTY